MITSTAAPDKDVEIISGASPVGKPGLVLRPVFAYGPHGIEDDTDDEFSVDSILVPEYPDGATVGGSFDPFFGINFGFMRRIQGTYFLAPST